MENFKKIFLNLKNEESNEILKFEMGCGKIFFYLSKKIKKNILIE